MAEDRHVKVCTENVKSGLVCRKIVRQFWNADSGRRSTLFQPSAIVFLFSSQFDICYLIVI